MKKSRIILSKKVRESIKGLIKNLFFFNAVLKPSAFLLVKGTLFVLLLISFIIITSFISPSFKQSNNISSQVDAVYNSYSTLIPDTIYHKEGEPYYTGDSTKVEIELTSELSQALDSELIDTYSKITVMDYKGDPLYGVIEVNNCHGYPELIIYMDCEDHNPLTTSRGWTGASYITSDKNVVLKFCVINSVDFGRTSVDYAVLMLNDYYPSSGNPIGAITVYRWFTNEFGDDVAQYNANYTTLNGTDIFSIFVNGYYGDGPANCYFNDRYHQTITYHNYMTRLAFYYFPKAGVNWQSFPNIGGGMGYSYGVLGRFGHKQGYIYFDDEDNDENIWGNDEPEEQQNHNALTGTGGAPNIGSCIEDGINTRLYFSSANVETECLHNPMY